MEYFWNYTRHNGPKNDKQFQQKLRFPELLGKNRRETLIPKQKAKISKTEDLVKTMKTSSKMKTQGAPRSRTSNRQMPSKNQGGANF